MTAMDERTVKVGDVELAIAEAGVGQRPFLLLHGFTGAKEDFAEWLDPLAATGWHAVAPDHRGHGASSKPDAEDAYAFEILAADALGLADELGWDRFGLLGHSMGGMVAQFVALEAPERLAALVLMDTGHGPVANLDPAMVEAAIGIVRTRGIDGLANLLADVDSPLDTPANRRLVAEQQGYAEFGDRKFRATSPALYAAMAPRMTSTPDRLEQLERLPDTLSTLVIVGEQDQPFLGPSMAMAEATGGKLEIIRDAGHSPQFENPDEWWKALSGFLGTLPT